MFAPNFATSCLPFCLPSLPWLGSDFHHGLKALPALLLRPYFLSVVLFKEPRLRQVWIILCAGWNMKPMRLRTKWSAIDLDDRRIGWIRKHSHWMRVIPSKSRGTHSWVFGAIWDSEMSGQHFRSYNLSLASFTST